MAKKGSLPGYLGHGDKSYPQLSDGLPSLLGIGLNCAELAVLYGKTMSRDS